MKTLRLFHSCFGYLGIVCVLGILGIFVLNYSREIKAARMEAVEIKMLGRLDKYHQTNGQYPNSLQMLIITNSPKEIQMLANVRLINYYCTNGGFVLSYKSADGYQSFRHERW